MLSGRVEGDLATVGAGVVEHFREKFVVGDEWIRRVAVLELDKHLHCLEGGDGTCRGFSLSLVDRDIRLVLGLCFAGWNVGRVEGDETGEE